MHKFAIYAINGRQSSSLLLPRSVACFKELQGAFFSDLSSTVIPGKTHHKWPRLIPFACSMRNQKFKEGLKQKIHTIYTLCFLWIAPRTKGRETIKEKKKKKEGRDFQSYQNSGKNWFCQQYGAAITKWSSCPLEVGQKMSIRCLCRPLFCWRIWIFVSFEIFLDHKSGNRKKRNCSPNRVFMEKNKKL